MTEDSKPVGSGAIIYSSFSYYLIFCSFTSASPACASSRVWACSHTPFSESWVIPPLFTNSARRGLRFVLCSPHPRTRDQGASTVRSHYTSVNLMVVGIRRKELCWLRGTSVLRKAWIFEQMCHGASTARPRPSERGFSASFLNRCATEPAQGSISVLKHPPLLLFFILGGEAPT